MSGFVESYDIDVTELLRRGAEGDPSALAKLWERHRERLHRMVELRLDRRLQGRLDPSDVLQEAFLDFAGRIGDYGGEAEFPFFLWLRALTSQRLMMLHRHHLGARMRDADREISLHRGAMPQASSISLAARLLGRLTSPSHAFARAEQRLVLQSALNRMDALDREVLALRYFEEMSNAEAAAVLGIDASAASTRHVRALKRLRKALESIPGFFDSPP